MGFLDRLFGRDDAATPVPARPGAAASAYRDADGQYAPPPADASAAADDDQRAIDQYRYLLRTAPPETIEQVHAEAFGRLTPAQRQQVLADLSSTLPETERPRDDAPQTLARAATRAEYTQPGYMERTFGGRSFRGGGFGSTLGASILGTIGGYVIGSALVSAFIAPAYADGGEPDQGDAAADQGGAADQGDLGADAGADAGFGDFGDFGGGFDGF